MQSRRPGFDPCIKKIPRRREWLPTPVFLSGKALGHLYISKSYMLQPVAGPCSEAGHTEGSKTSSQSFELLSLPWRYSCVQSTWPTTSCTLWGSGQFITEYTTVENVTFSHLNFIHLVPLFTPIPLSEHPLISLV